jgi:hypothetical protein
LAIGLTGFASAPNEVVVLISIFIAGIGLLFGVTTTNSNLQRRLDEDMRGRVMALWGAWLFSAHAPSPGSSTVASPTWCRHVSAC